MGRRPTGGQGQHRTGESPPSGIAGGPAATWTRVERGTHLAYRKSEWWKLSAYSYARRRSIPTPQPAHAWALGEVPKGRQLSIRRIWLFRARLLLGIIAGTEELRAWRDVFITDGFQRQAHGLCREPSTTM